MMEKREEVIYEWFSGLHFGHEEVARDMTV
jgi:hypothetical protein